jgi:hypothetical protein
MTRIRDAAALQLIGWRYRLGWPWVVMCISLVANIMLFSAGSGDAASKQGNWGLASIVIGEMIFGGQVIAQVFPFAVNLSMTRRSFYTAAIVSIVVRSVAFSIVLLGLKLMEDATDGWGGELRFFGPPGLAQHNPAVQLLSYTMLFVVLDLVALVAATAYARWRVNGLYTLVAGAGLVAACVASLLTWQQWWGGVHRWFADQPRLLLIGAWPLLVAALLGYGGFLIIRRATLR